MKIVKKQRRNYYKQDLEYMQQTGRLPGGGWSERSQRIRLQYLRKLQKTRLK